MKDASIAKPIHLSTKPLLRIVGILHSDLNWVFFHTFTILVILQIILLSGAAL